MSYLSKVDWARLTHAFGYAVDVPDMLRSLISSNPKERREGWSDFHSIVNHSGDYYDSTVAAVPVLIEFLSNPEAAGKTQILQYFHDRWLDAADYGGDPGLAEPPGGVDDPTPIRDLNQPPKTQVDVDDESFLDDLRSMDLCAWQTARAIEAGVSTYKLLLDNDDSEVAGAAAEVLMLLNATRDLGRERSIELIEQQFYPATKIKQILGFGVYSRKDDLPKLKRWIEESTSPAVAAAGLVVYCWHCTELPPWARPLLEQLTEPDNSAFNELPYTGAFRGLGNLPTCSTWIVPRLAQNENAELRQKGVQALVRQGNLPDTAAAILILANRLDDAETYIRYFAARGLAERW